MRNPDGIDGELASPQKDVARKLVEQQWRSAWRPPDRRPAWEWAEEHVQKIPYSPIPGRFRSSNSPWIREPLEALTDVSVRKVQIVAGIQASKTLLMEIGSCALIKNHPGPMLWLDQKDEEAADELENRLKVLWKECPPVAELLPGSTGKHRYKSKRNQVRFLNGVPFWCLGAHNKKNLQRRSIRTLIGDETWSWPKGHQQEAEARVTAFGWLGKIFFSSQAGEEDDDTDKSFLSGTQEEWNFRCLNPDCETLQPYVWEHAEWSKEAKGEDGTYDYDLVEKTARITCKECGHEHDSNQQRIRNQMNHEDRAEYVVMNPNAPSGYRSFHWNSMCSVPIGKLAVLYLRAKESAKRGDMEDLKIFYQKRLAVPWRDTYEDFKFEIERSNYLMGDEWDEEAVIWRNGTITTKDATPDPPDPNEYDYQADYQADLRRHNKLVGPDPIRGKILTVDCQRDHFWVSLFSFSPTGNARLMWCGGGRSPEEHGSKHPVIFWEDIDKIVAEHGVAPHLVFVDAGYDTSRVYLETARRGWTALMGDQRATFTHKVQMHRNEPPRPVERFYSKARTVNLGGGLAAKVHYYSNLNIKDIFARIRKNQDPDEGATFEVPDNVPEWYLKHLDSEQRVKKGNKYVWEQIGKRPNHGWDCAVMAYAALVMMKLLGKESVADGDVDSGDPEE